MTPINMDILSSSARLALTEDEKQNLEKDVAAILALGQMLGKEDGNDFNSDTPDFSLVSAALRADKPAESLSQKETLSLAPSACDGHVTVARVLAAEGSGEDRA